MGIPWKLQINYFSKTLWIVTFSKQIIFDLNQCHSKVEKSGGQTIGENNRKSDFFCMISTTLTKAVGRVTVSRTFKHKWQESVPVL